MSEIRQGDLVVVRRNHCTARGAGYISKVRQIATGTLHCLDCGSTFSGASQRIARLDDGDYGSWFPIEHLSKIEPLREPEKILREEEVPA